MNCNREQENKLSMIMSIMFILGVIIGSVVTYYVGI
jgi:uncharacterized membrane protein YciS (DUF1049 family)